MENFASELVDRSEEYVRKLALSNAAEAFLCGGLYAMQRDVALVLQLEHQAPCFLRRLAGWVQHWRGSHFRPFGQGGLQASRATLPPPGGLPNALGTIVNCAGGFSHGLDINAPEIEVLLQTKADRFLRNSEYLEHIEKCVNELSLQGKSRKAFVFGGLDALQHDIGSALQMTMPPHKPSDIASRRNRIQHLMNWKPEVDRLFSESTGLKSL